MAARRSKRRKPAARRKPARKPARKPTPRKTAKRAAAGSLEALARRFIRAAQRPETFAIAEIYTPDCVSIEAVGNVDRGHVGIEAKMKRWEAMQTGGKWTPRNVFIGKNVICIEWDAEVTLRDGRVVRLPEVAVHEIAGGKIARERYYYNPLVLAPPVS
jgi:ketosteroid isomerase-like protein